MEIWFIYLKSFDLLFFSYRLESMVDVITNRYNYVVKNTSVISA